MMQPQQVHHQILLVGSGTRDAVLTDPHDCHTYLVWDGTGGFLIDSGTGLGFERWAASVRAICDPAALGGCLITHYHADHAGGAARVAELGVPVFGSTATAEALGTGDEDRTQMDVARRSGVYPANYTLRAANLQQVTDGQLLRSGHIQIETVDAPGHCDGHVVFLVEIQRTRVMFSGDCLLANGTVSMQAIPDCRLDVYANTVMRLAEQNIDVLLPGHGDLVLSNAREQISSAAASFARLIPPPNFLLPSDKRFQLASLTPRDRTHR